MTGVTLAGIAAIGIACVGIAAICGEIGDVKEGLVNTKRGIEETWGAIRETREQLREIVTMINLNNEYSRQLREAMLSVHHAIADITAKVAEEVTGVNIEGIQGELVEHIKEIHVIKEGYKVGLRTIPPGFVAFIEEGHRLGGLIS